MTIWVHKIPQKPIVTVEGAERGIKCHLTASGSVAIVCCTLVKIVEFGARIANPGINHSTAGDIFRWQLRFGYHAVYTQTLVVESYARLIVKSGAVRCNA